MAVQALYALQNGFIGFERSGLFYGERSDEKVQIPVACYLVLTGDAAILFDAGFAPRAIPGLHELGTLKPGAVADVAVLDVKDGDFEFVDNYQTKRLGHHKLVTQAVIVNGKRV
jgi:hypothetical protein